jgi:hypothetical protein
MTNEVKIIEATDDFIRGNQDWLDDGVEISNMADDTDVRIYIVNEHEQFDGIEKFILDEFDISAHSLDFIRIEFYDEVVGCCECYNQIYTTPTSAFWHQDWWTTEYGYVCNTCVKEKLAEEYLEHLTNNPKNANTILSHDELKHFEWERLEYEYTVGMNYGYSDNPKDLFEHLEDKYENIIFSITSTTPFDTSFSVYVKNTEE